MAAAYGVLAPARLRGAEDNNARDRPFACSLAAHGSRGERALHILRFRDCDA